MKHLLLLLLLVCSSVSRADMPAVHGFLLFGNQVTYASHLPMFHAPHDHQLLLKLSLRDTRLNTLEAYSEAKKTSTGYFTLLPEVMDLSKVISGEKTSFLASIYQGHFERGGKYLGSVLVHVEKVIFSADLNPQAAIAANKYLVFGHSPEYFAAHLIQAKPSFDAVLSVGQPQTMSQPVCHNRRICPESGSVAVADSQLPLALNAVQSPQAPSSGESLGELSGVVADVLNQIYFDDSDLGS